MSDRPIIFSAPMIRALFDGRKTMTRRLATSPLRKCVAGERLWVRENIRVVSDGLEYAADGEQLAETEAEWSDRAADVWNRYAHDDDGPDLHPTTIPSIFCPRWVSRLTLSITATKIERLQDIIDDDARAEGMIPHVRGGWHWRIHDPSDCGDWDQFGYLTPRLAFQALWEGLHGREAWDANPVVVALSFTFEHRNIDAPPAKVALLPHEGIVS